MHPIIKKPAVIWRSRAKKHTHNGAPWGRQQMDHLDFLCVPVRYQGLGRLHAFLFFFFFFSSSTLQYTLLWLLLEIFLFSPSNNNMGHTPPPQRDCRLFTSVPKPDRENGLSSAPSRNAVSEAASELTEGGCMPCMCSSRDAARSGRISGSPLFVSLGRGVCCLLALLEIWGFGSGPFFFFFFLSMG